MCGGSRTRREEGFCRRFLSSYNPAFGDRFFVLKNLSKKSPRGLWTHCVSTQHTPLPVSLGNTPKSRFSPSLKGDRLYRISGRTVARGVLVPTQCAVFTGCPRLACLRRGQVLLFYPPHWWRSFRTVTPNPLKTKSQLAVPSPCWAFCFKGGSLGKPKSRNEQRAVKWVLGFGGTEVDRRAGACRRCTRLPAVSLGQRQFNAAPRQTHRYEHLWQGLGA